MHKLVRLIGLSVLAGFLWVCIAGCPSRVEPDKTGDGPKKDTKADKTDKIKVPSLPKKDTPPADAK